MESTKTTYTFKARIAGWIIDKTTETAPDGKTETWYELVRPGDPENPIEAAFKNRDEMKAWAHNHPAC